MDFTGKSLEYFTEDALQHVLAEDTKLHHVLDVLDKKIESVQARIVEVNTSVSRIEGLQRDIEISRQERQVLLAEGRDHQKISANIKKLQEKIRSTRSSLEILIDEKNGLEDVLTGLQKERQQLMQNIERLDFDVKLFQHFVAVNLYNEEAEKFAEIVSLYWKTRDSLPNSYKDITWGKGIPTAVNNLVNTGLWRLPFLRLNWEKGAGQKIFHFTRWKDSPETY